MLRDVVRVPYRLSAGRSARLADDQNRSTRQDEVEAGLGPAPNTAQQVNGFGEDRFGRDDLAGPAAEALYERGMPMLTTIR